MILFTVQSLSLLTSKFKNTRPKPEVLPFENSACPSTFSENYVRYWTSLIPEVKQVGSESKFVRNHRQGFEIWDGERPLVEYDHLIKFRGKQFCIEVKSGGFNGYFGKLPNILEISKKCVPEFGGMIIFAPIHSKERQNLTLKMCTHYAHQISFVDLGFSRKKFASKYFRLL